MIGSKTGSYSFAYYKIVSMEKVLIARTRFRVRIFLYESKTFRETLHLSEDTPSVTSDIGNR